MRRFVAASALRRQTGFLRPLAWLGTNVALFLDPAIF